VAEKFDAIAIGAGIAGLGVSALLETPCVEKDAQAGGRMQSFDVEGGKVRGVALNSTALSGRIFAEEILGKFGH
jgi:phytoene dehydrogenase-like protein